MSDNCIITPTATLYTTAIVVTDPSSFTDGSVDDGGTVTQLIPTATLYASDCVNAIDTSTSRTRRVTSTPYNAEVTSSTAYLPTSTATLVSASNRGGQVVYVTSYSTASAASVIIVVKTRTPTNVASATASPTSKPKASSHAGAIAGGIVAAVFLLALLAACIWFCRKRARRHRDTRALDEFFKDALNPGDAAAVAVVGSNGRRSTLLRRKSSTMLDLEKEKDLSHSNDEDNWAALTRLSDQVDGDEITGPYHHHHRSQSRQSLNAVSRAVSVSSMGPEAVWSDAAGVIGSGEPRPINVEKQSMSSTSLTKSPSDESRHLGNKRHSSQISSKSTDLLPSLSPGLASAPNSPNFIESPPLSLGTNRSEDMLVYQHPPASPPASMTRQSHARMAQRLSMSNIAPTPNSPPQRSLSPPLHQGMPERPKSALGVMGIAEEIQEQPLQQQEQILQRQQSMQRSFQRLPRQPIPSQWSSPHRQGSTGVTLQSRASISGYGQNSYSQWSLNHGSQRYGSSHLQQFQQHSTRQRRQQTFSGEYPPSRYSHLDIVSASTEGEASKDEGIPRSASRLDTRARSMSGGILIKPGAEIIPSSTEPASDSNNSSTSNSKKNSLSIRNASPEDTSEEEEGQGQIVSKKKGDSARVTLHHVEDHNGAASEMEEEKTTQKTSDYVDVGRITSFFSPRAWRAKA